MCGIVAVVGKTDFKMEKAFKLMLQLDVVRGKDSTGIIGVDTAYNVMMAKEAWLPQDLLDSRDAKAIFAKTNLKCLIGHNRAATVGAVNKAGAHPFEFENIIGVHNGTTDKWHFKNGRDYTVDSEALYDHANEEGMEDAWSKVNKAASLAYFDKRDDKFHLLRNSERPMCFAFSKDNATLFCASEAWMIRVATSKVQVELNEEFGIKNTSVDTLYSFSLGADVKEYERLEVQPFRAPVSKVTTFHGPASKEGRLNTTARSYVALTTGENIDFRVMSWEEGTYGVEFQIASTETPVELLGRMFIPNREPELMASLKSKDSDEFRGRIQSIMGYGNTKGFSIGWMTVVDHRELFDDDLEDTAASFYVDGSEHVTINREMFNKGDVIQNTCCWCSDPLDFDQLDFKVVRGSVSGTAECVCAGCLSSPSMVDYMGQYCELDEVFPVTYAS